MLPVDLNKARGKSPIPPEPVEKTEVKHLMEEPYKDEVNCCILNNFVGINELV